MPIYEYECKNGHRFERIESMLRPEDYWFDRSSMDKDKHANFCPECSTVYIKQIMFPGGTGIVLKGGGWSKDGYAGKNK